MTHKKICFTCKKLLTFSYFSVDKQKKDGLNSSCKNCYSLKRKAALSKYNTSEKHKVANLKWKGKNKEYVKALSAFNLKEYLKQMKKATLKPFKTYSLLREARSRARKLTKDTGVQYSIDHIVPLRGANVSGLHVPWNIQIIPLSENAKKGNRLCRP